MGDPKKPRKKYKTPRHPWKADVLMEELQLVGEYGLRNKRELWRAKTELSKYRRMAMSLLGEPPERRAELENILLSKLRRMGLVGENATLDDVLDLTIRDLLDRRLQTVVYKMGLAKTIHQARQLITHGHISIGERRVTSPGYIVLKDEEPLVRFSPDSPFKAPLAAAEGGAE